MVNGTDPGENTATTDAGGTPRERLPPETVLELDPVYEALGHSRRRYLCYTLFEDTEWSLTELATKVAAWETDVPEHAVSDDEREAVSVSLFHAHVPKLVEVGVITFDEATETITPGEHTEQVLAVLQGMGHSLDTEHESHARSEMDDPTIPDT